MWFDEASILPQYILAWVPVSIIRLPWLNTTLKQPFSQLTANIQPAYRYLGGSCPILIF